IGVPDTPVWRPVPHTGVPHTAAQRDRTRHRVSLLLAGSGERVGAEPGFGTGRRPHARREKGPARPAAWVRGPERQQHRRAGLLAYGSSRIRAAFPRSPAVARSPGFWPITAAALRRNCTGFPLRPVVRGADPGTRRSVNKIPGSPGVGNNAIALKP